MSKEVVRYLVKAGSECSEMVYASDYDALLAERDALKKDAERLDWLMSQDNCVVQEATSGFWLQWIDEHDPQLSRYQSGEYPSGREAIDAALQGAQP